MSTIINGDLATDKDFLLQLAHIRADAQVRSSGMRYLRIGIGILLLLIVIFLVVFWIKISAYAYICYQFIWISIALVGFLASALLIAS